MRSPCAQKTHFENFVRSEIVSTHGDGEGDDGDSKQIMFVLMHRHWEICTPVICIVARQGLSHHEKVQVFSHSNSKPKNSDPNSK